ncbi:MAG: HAD-IC family P-type ATPase [Myxococcota bacterium]
MSELMRDGWHALDSQTVLHRLAVEPAQGLSESEVALRRQRHGLNTLKPRRPRPALLRFLSQFHQPLIYILLAATVITAALREWVDASVILAVVVLNAVVGFVQESKALHAIAALARTLVSEATVIRDGKRRRVSAAELVPGDVVVLQSGDKVPADLRLLTTRDLEVDESTLTGESQPVPKQADITLPPDTLLAERLNTAYASTNATRGQALGVVTATGDRTEVGRISELMASAEQVATPLTRKIHHFSHLLLTAILALALATFILGVWRGESAFHMFMAAVALMVGAIPEGLPAAITIMLALGVSRMAHRRAVIRKLPAVETLGSTNVICSDKTGTLTENRMTVTRVLAGGEVVEVPGAGYAATSWEAASRPALRECLRAGLLCNDSRVVEREGHWRTEGDPTEGALLLAASAACLDLALEEQRHPRLDTIPFESSHQYMATLHAPAGEGPAVVYLKGSVEAVLARCDQVLDAAGATIPIDANAIHGAAERMASDGLRVLALARTTLPPGRRVLKPGEVARGLTFLGLQGMLDPPRDEARVAVRKCRNAGIDVKMITGDHALTARVIAEKLGLGPVGRSGRPVALTGRELDTLGEEELQLAAEQTTVFARVTPEQKLRLVRALQTRGHVVAMTGDGVNDGPALRQANIGIAMGITGTDVAKDAADMVLIDDNFASIEAAVEEGRGVFDNLTKFIVWTLPTNLGEALIVLASVVLGTTLPVLPVQILWINMTTAVLLGLTLAFEPAEPDVMERPPRPPDEPILTHDLIMRTLFVGSLMLVAGMGLFELELVRGASEAQARTATVNSVVMMELFYLFNCRSLVKPMRAVGWGSNPWVFVGCGAMLLVQLLFTYSPVMNRLFSSAPMPFESWLLIVLAGVAVLLLVGLEKSIRLRHGMGGPQRAVGSAT